MALVLGILAVIVLVFGPGLWVQRVLDRYSVPANRYSGTGEQLARHLLDRNGLQNVTVEATELGDHYDPEAKAVRLSEGNFGGSSLTAITVAAHEVGHALQDHHGYAPLRLRTRLVKATRGIEKIGAGVLMLGTSALVHFITLPTEFNASFARALPMLDDYSILKSADKRHAHKLLTAAALTYVSASLMSLLNIARWIAILRR